MTPPVVVQAQAPQATAPPAALAARPVPTSIRFSIVFLLSVIAGLGAIIAINVLGNGTKLFPSPGFPPATCIRAWKARRAAQLARSADPPRAFVLGSSRVFSLQESAVRAVTGLPAFNFGVSVGCPVDFLAHLRFVLQAGLRPKTIVIGLDELAFGDNPEADIYDMQLVTHAGVFDELALRDRAPIVVRILKTLSLKTTADSARNLWRRWRHHGPYYAPDDDSAAGDLEGTHDPDWDAMPAEKRREELAQGIERLTKFWGKYLDRPDKIEGMRPTARRMQLFEQLLDLAASNGIEVRVALLPVHPELERRIFTPRLLEIRAELARTLADEVGRRGFVFRDYTRLGSFGGTAEDFQDGTHMAPANGRRLLSALFSGR
jgi:hypothetical protein